MPSSILTNLIIFVLATSLTISAHHCPANPPSSLNFGSCPNPRIYYGFNIDGSQRYGYAPANGTQFPHSWSPDIATIESFICNRLESPCNAPPETVATCRSAFDLYSGLSGHWAVDAWNVALGLTPHSHEDDDNDTTCEDQGYLTTTTTTVFVDHTFRPGTSIVGTTTTETLTAEITTTRTKTYTTKTHTVPSPSSTLTITVTLPSSTTTDAEAISSTSTSTSTSTTTTTETTDTTTSVTAAETASGSSDSNGNGSGGGSGQGSPFDSESSAPPSMQPSRSKSSPLLFLGLATLMMAFML